MKSIGTFLVVAYEIGAIVSFLLVFPARVGFSPNPSVYLSAWQHVPSRRNGIPWAFGSFLKAAGWPVLLAIWIRGGRPPSSVLFGAAAAERLGRDASELDYSARGFATKWTAS